MIKPLKRPSTQDLKSAIIANSAALTLGDYIVPGTSTSSEFVSEATNSSALLLGVILGFEGKGGTVLELDALTVASNNQTVAQSQAVYLPSYIPMEFSADLNAAAGTTSGSDGIGFFTIASGLGGTLDESSWVAFSGTASHFVSFGPDPLNSSKVFGHTYKTL